MAVLQWDDYLTGYHRARPGITEAALNHARDVTHGSPYEWLARALPDRLGHVLDVACGNAALQPALPGYATYLGVDLSAAELDRARDLGRGPVVRGDARALPVRDQSTDTVLASMGLMLVRPLTQAVAEIARVLRPGGTVAVLLPSARPLRLGDLPGLLALSVPLRGPGAMPQRVSARRMGREMARVGLHVETIQTHRFAFPLRTPADAQLAVRALYTPDRSEDQVVAAEAALVRRVGPHAELPVPLMRIVARRPRGPSDGLALPARAAGLDGTGIASSPSRVSCAERRLRQDETFQPG
jgi:SAM-dependent methyltransferase